MDTTELYKMCEKAEEIQDNYIPQDGDVVFHNGKVQIFHIKEVPVYFSWSGYIWLPRQDQLQEMYREYQSNREPFFEATTPEAQNAFMLREIVRFNDTRYCASMEQLWLAFVMKEKAGKIWNGMDWIDA